MSCHLLFCIKYLHTYWRRAYNGKYIIGGVVMGRYSRQHLGKPQYALVNKGTVNSLSALIDTFSDWYNNFTQPFGYSPDMRNSINFAKQRWQATKPADLTFVGHSKGGAEAIGNAVATGCHVITFNSARPFLNKYNLNPNNHPYSKADTLYVKGEALSQLMGTVNLGKPHRINPRYGTAHVQTWTMRIYNHGMDAVVWRLSK